MRLRVRSRAILCTCFFALLLSSSLQAQDAVLHPDTLFKQARQMAFAGRYTQSRQLSRQLLQLAPAYTDATLLIARTYAWEHHYDSARIVLSPLLSTAPPHEEALLVMADMALWAHKPEEALNYVQAGLCANPASAPLLLREARARQQLQDYAAAEAILTPLLQQDPGNTEARQVWEKVQQARQVNILQAGYQVTAFDDETLTPWQLGSLEYTRLKTSGRYLARVSYAQRYGYKSMQGEVDAYPQLSKTTYAYLNVGASDEKLFPAYRSGAELYHLFPHKVEASVGARALFFRNETVVLYTGYVGKYFSRQWVSFRPFVQRLNGSWQTTGILQLRQYLRHEDEYITLALARGSVPFVQVGFEEISRLSASRAALEAQFRVGRSFLLGGMFAYDYEEYTQGSYRNRFTTGLTVQHKF